MSDTTSGLRRSISGAADLQSVVRTMKAVAGASIGQDENASARWPTTIALSNWVWSPASGRACLSPRLQSGSDDPRRLYRRSRVRAGLGTGRAVQ